MLSNETLHNYGHFAKTRESVRDGFREVAPFAQGLWLISWIICLVLLDSTASLPSLPFPSVVLCLKRASCVIHILTDGFPSQYEAAIQVILMISMNYPL